MGKSTRQSAQAEPRPVTELTFEQALVELERIVALMEAGELGLEPALAAHRRGLELARHCQKWLDAAQQQVKVLEGEVLKPLSALEPPTGERD